MASLRAAEGLGRARRQERASQRLLRDHAQCRAGSGRAAARDLPGAGQGLSRPPRARLPRGLQPLATAVEEGRALGRLRGSRAVARAADDLRARGGDRGLRRARVLDDRRPGGEGRAAVRRTADAVPRREGRAVHDHDRRAGRGGARRAQPGRGRQPHRRERRPEAAQAQPRAAFHDLDAAAGGRAQARLRRAAHHARRPAALRGHGFRRGTDRSHHLHAHRLGEPRGRGRARDPLDDRAAVWRGSRCRMRRGRIAPSRRMPRRRTRPCARLRPRVRPSSSRASSTGTSSSSTRSSGAAPWRARWRPRCSTR